MTQIVSISATTAAYAAEPLRPSARVSGAGQTQETTHAQTIEARAADNLRHTQMSNVVGAAAITLFFLTAGERGKRLQQTTMRQAEEAYFLGHEDDMQDASDEQSDDAERDNEEFQEGQNVILALPAPDNHSQN